MEFGDKRWTSSGVLLVDPFQLKSSTNLCKSEFRCKKKKRPPKWKFSKKCHLGGRNDGIWLKTIKQLWSPSRWPIFNWKAVQICVNLKFGPKKLMELGEKWWTSYGVLLVDPFPIEKLHKFAWIWIPTQKKKRAPNKKFSKKCHFGGWNDGNWKKNGNLLWSPTRWPISNWKAAQICINLNFGTKKRAPKRKFSKRMPFFGGQNDGIGQKMMNLVPSPTRWPISN